MCSPPWALFLPLVRPRPPVALAPGCFSSGAAESEPRTREAASDKQPPHGASLPSAAPRRPSGRPSGPSAAAKDSRVRRAGGESRCELLIRSLSHPRYTLWPQW